MERKIGEKENIFEKGYAAAAGFGFSYIYLFYTIKVRTHFSLILCILFLSFFAHY